MIAPRSPRRTRGRRPHTRPGLLGSAPLAAALLAAPLHAQKSAANIEADLAFARGLASKWSFVDLAEEVIRDVGSGRLDAEQQEALALLRCEIYTVGARNERDPARRNQLFEDSLSCLDGYIGENSRAANVGDAEQAFVEASQLYARSLEIALEDAIGDEAAALSAKRIDVLTKGVARTENLVNAISAIPEEERTEKQTAQRFELMLSRGQMYATISAAQKDDPFFQQRAIQVLEALVFEAGEGTPFALRAYAALGDVYMGSSQYEDAAAYYDGVADQVIPFEAAARQDLLGWDQMPAPMKQRRFLFVELAMPGILRAYTAAGDDTMALERALWFWNMRQKEAFDLSQFGYDALLQVANVMLASDGYLGGDLTGGQGEWFATEEEMTAKYRQRRLQSTTTDFALQLANQVAQDAPANAQKTSAGKLIAEIGERPGVRISADQIYKAALAKYREKDYVGAREGVHELLRRMEELEPAQQVEFGAKAYNLLGDVLRNNGRELEAAMAYREGAVTWTDPEYDEKNAKGFQYLVGRLVKSAPEAEEVKALAREAEDVITSKGPEMSGDRVRFARASRAQDAGRWEEAIQAYGELGEASDDYEVAYVNIGVCQAQNGQVREALERFNNYLNVVREDPARRTESPSLLARRKQASATAEYYRGSIYYAVAKEKAKNGDTSGYAKVVEYLEGFEKRYSEQTSLCTNAVFRVVDSLAKLGREAEAQAAFDAMLAEYPGEALTGTAATAIYKMYEAEYDAAKDDAAKRAAYGRKMALSLQSSNKIDAAPDWDKLKREADLWFDAGAWEEAKAAYGRLIARFGDEAARRKQVEQYVAPAMGYALLQLREVNEAKDFLAPFAMGGTPTKRTVQYFGMAVTGWLEGGSAGVSVVPGAGGTDEEFQFITDKLTAIQKAGTSWTSCEWYEDKLAEIYAFYVWGMQNSQKQGSAKNMIEGTQPFIDNDVTFGIVDQYCTTDEETPAELKARLGNGTLRARYQWLWSKTR